ncbi:DUF1183-domain-containing protein [Pleomassaria siparia CBS 279.74]|uniref:Store-operated calcium entry-associated regulatory factor n=1 Tax=Pleomassaria siparia CBS 279.74 TaxID=1314801 RepID=A0A6G1KQN8_9PLEO|nr:DUF1183-domain-containing protein [Pleomassaria siparia CBS 279.74]
MHYSIVLYPALLATTTLFDSALATTTTRAAGGSKIKLSNVQSLTLRDGAKTSHRRVSAIPQLKCVGGSARGLYSVDIMRCNNAGFDYSKEDVQWTCAASLPEEFKLGSTDVICEGYDSPDDEYVLKGSCGVEYRLLLTDEGQEKYPGGRRPHYGDDDDYRPGYPKTRGEKAASILFWMLFVGVAVWILYNIASGWAANRGLGGAAGARPGWGGGGGGGGGGWGGGHDDTDPPPPYDYQGGSKPRPNYGATEGWRPGFWSGAMGGAAAGYAAGRSGNRTSNNNNNNNGWGFNNNNGEGSSRPSSGSSSSPSYSSPRHESTGFGSTSRR